jgi:hypothetical protein
LAAARISLIQPLTKVSAPGDFSQKTLIFGLFPHGSAIASAEP